MARFSGKHVLITGASSGIGEAIAIRFAQEGGNVAINYNSGADRAEKVKRKAEAAAASAGNGKARHLTVQANHLSAPEALVPDT